MVSIKFETLNAAFDGVHKAYEIARILRELADKVEGGYCTGKLKNVFYYNGNIIGKFRVED